MKLRRSLVLAVGLCAALAPAVASASPALDLVGAVGGNGGVQAVAGGASGASTYFNPAFLTEASEDLLLGYALVSEQISVQLDGRNGGDVPIDVAQRNLIGGDGLPIANDSVPTEWLRQGCPAGTTPGTCPAPGFAARPRQSHAASGHNRSYAVIGLVRQLLRDRLSLGFYAMLPVGSFTTARGFLPDERESLFTNSLYPELYGDRLTGISLAFGAGVKLVPMLSLGVGLSMGVQNAAQSQTYVRDSSNYDLLIINNDVKTSVNLAPTFGVRFEPLSMLRFGAAVHAPEKFSIDTTLAATLPNGAVSSSTRSDVFDWMPWRFVLGGEADVVSGKDQALTVAASGSYSLWSKYQDRHGQSPTCAWPCQSSADQLGSDLKWKDTLAGSLGLRHRAGRFREFIDFSYIPSPVAEQVGRTNYVDNTRLGLALGGDANLELGSFKLRVGLQLFGQRLLSRHNTKDDARMRDELPDDAVLTSTHAPVPGASGLQTNNPGWPGFGSDGWVYGGGISLSTPL